MATEKILIFDESGNAKRMKVRIARFLDNEPVTATDKENIRTTLDVDGSQSGTFTTPLSVTSASDSSFSGGGDLNVSGGVTTLTNSGDNALRVESTNGNPMTVNVVGAAQNYIFDVRDDGASKFRVDGSGKVGIGTGTATPARQLHVKGNGTLSQFESTSTSAYLSLLESGGNHTYLGNAVGDFVIQTASGGYSSKLVVYNGGNVAVPHGNLVMSSGGIDFGSGASTTIHEYEEGTHVVTATTTGAGTVALDSAADRFTYTKIGNIVQINGSVKIASTSGASGDLVLSLPVAAADLNDTAGRVGGAVDFEDYGVGYSPKAFRIDESGSSMYVTVDASTLAANDQIRVSLTYRTTSS